MQRYKVKVFIIFVLTVFCTLPANADIAKTDEHNLPFTIGEKATYQLRWGFIPAGHATLARFPDQDVNGEPAYHFVLQAWSNRYIDPFFKVRDRIDSFADLDMNRSLLYKKNQHEGRTKRDIIVNFDWQKNQAQYSNYGEKRDPISILPGTFDPLGIFFYTRMLDLKENDEITHPVTDGKSCMNGQAKIIKRETITVPGGTFDAFLMEPDLKDVRGVFEKSKNAKLQLWVTADERKLLIKIKSKVIVGSFIGELITLEN